MKYLHEVWGSIKPKSVVSGPTTVYLHSEPILQENGDFKYEEIQMSLEEYQKFTSGELTGVPSDFIEKYNSYVKVELSDSITSIRDSLLAETDWTQTLDAPITKECSSAFRTYRQALRDITEQKGYPHTITWPEKPKVVKGSVTPVDTTVDSILTSSLEG